MTQQAVRLLQDLLRLPESERSELAVKLIESLEPAPEDDVEDAWAEEIRLRIEELDSGAVKPVPWAQARQQIMDDDNDSLES